MGIPELSPDSTMKILIDNGHGLNTPGKRSPDGKFLEAAHNREIAKSIVSELKNKGYDTELLVPEKEDTSLKERVRRINAACSATPSCPAVLTENFFQDCLSDVLFLHIKAGKQAVVDTHVEGIVEYIMAVC